MARWSLSWVEGVELGRHRKEAILVIRVRGDNECDNGLEAGKQKIAFRIIQR